jgi:hypothetical protein
MIVFVVVNTTPERSIRRWFTPLIRMMIPKRPTAWTSKPASTALMLGKTRQMSVEATGRKKLIMGGVTTRHR